MIQQAADVTNKSMSAFLLDAGTDAAERALAQREQFALDEERWQQFAEALERPVVEKPRLRDLMRTPGVLD